MNVPLSQGWEGHVDPGIKSSIVAFSMAVGVCLAILWRYVFARYAGAPAETWRHADHQGVTPHPDACSSPCPDPADPCSENRNASKCRSAEICAAAIEGGASLSAT